MGKPNYRKIYAIQKKNEQILLKINPDLDNGSGIYFLTREDENGIKFSYVGQAKHILQRMCQHMTGYQHIDLSIRKHGFYSEENPHGWKLGFIHCKENELDELERKYIILYAQKGYQSRNKDTGGGKGKEEVGQRKEAKGYRDGLAQGKKTLARELSHIIEKHLTVNLQNGKEHNKISQKALEKFWDLLNEGNY